MQATLVELAALVGGRIIGDDRLTIVGAAVLRDAKPGQITLVDQAEKGRLLEGCRTRPSSPRGDLLPMESRSFRSTTYIRRFRPSCDFSRRRGA